MRFFLSNQRLLFVLVVAIGLGLYGLSVPLRARRQQSTCQSNLKGLGLAMFQYVRDYDEKYPLASHWSDDLRPYSRWIRSQGVASSYECPTTQRHYALNSGVSGLTLAQVIKPEKLALFYEPSGPIKTDNGASWPLEDTHDGGSNVCFADGHVKLLKSKPSFWLPKLAVPSSHNKTVVGPTPPRPKTAKPSSP